MLKVLLSLMFISSLVFSDGLKATGCDLSQVGDVNFNLNGKSFKKVSYKAIAPSGKNFRSILVGSVINIEYATMKIVDIKADKRVKRQPRTGLITVSLDADDVTQEIEMKYQYSKGHFTAKGLQKNGKNIGFALDIKALLCHAP